MDAGEIFGTALIAAAAVGSAVVIAVGLTKTIIRFVSNTVFKKRV